MGLPSPGPGGAPRDGEGTARPDGSGERGHGHQGGPPPGGTAVTLHARTLPAVQRASLHYLLLTGDWLFSIYVFISFCFFHPLERKMYSKRRFNAFYPVY